MINKNDDFFPPPWNPNEHEEKTQGWIGFQMFMRQDPNFYLDEHVSRWIKIEDQLPELNVPVLCYFNSKLLSMIKYIVLTPYIYAKDTQHELLMYKSIDRTWRKEDIYAWMPLPKIPE